MRRIALVVVTFGLLGLMGCTRAQMNSLRGAAGGGNTAAKKDCAACEKMCAVAADAEKNPDAVAACKADCKKSCTE